MPPGLTVEDSPVELLLKEQQTLQTPVGVFSERHEKDVEEPEQAQFYKQLIPLSKPKAGEQYAFHVDLDKCTGCKACVSACHSLNGLDEHETWRDVGTIHGFDEGGSYSQTVTTACHHCVDPGCLNGCPVLAYEKDEDTGIVRHLDDQCIGCQYCVLKCPYDVPKYSKSLGIVRKCDMCHSRLAEGEAPACVQACPTEAISITIVNNEQVVAEAQSSGEFLAGAPEPSYTVPTTKYTTKRRVPANTDAADLAALRPEHAHLPLVFMLVFTQFSVGLYAAEFLLGEPSTLVRIVALAAMSIGLGASVLHLGRPLGAWRAFLGLRRSWLSREIVTFGVFSLFAPAYTFGIYNALTGPLTIGFGVLGIFTSVMIYHDTQRPFWTLKRSVCRFFGTTLLLGLATYVALTGVSNPFVLGASIATLLGLFAFDLAQILPVKGKGYSPDRKSALLMMGPLKTFMYLRMVLLGVGAIGLTAALASPPFAVLASCALLPACLIERVLFFKAVVAPKMPGGVHT